MNESTLTGILAGAAVVTAGMCFASYKILEGEVQFAEVLAVQPVVESVQKPRQECPEELIATLTSPAFSGGGPALQAASVVMHEPVKPEKAAGVHAGAAASSPQPLLPQRSQQSKESASPGRALGGGHPDCRTVYDSIMETVAYDVIYRLGDREGTVRMNFDPGKRIPVRDGELVLTPDSRRP